MTDLLPCPFCGNAAMRNYTGAGKKRRHYVVCTFCLARTRNCVLLLEAKALWNQRVTA